MRREMMGDGREMKGGYEKGDGSESAKREEVRMSGGRCKKKRHCKIK